MESNEIRSWFDQAFLKMSQGDFARASACFQVIIDRSGDRNAIQSARRDLAWCAPIQAIVERLDSTPHPIALSELISELSPALKRSEPGYERVLVERLSKIQTILPTNDREWVARSQLQAAFERGMVLVTQERAPHTFSQLAGDLFAEYGQFQLTLTPALLTFVNAILWRSPELVALDHGCLFHRSTLADFAASFATLIRRETTAQALRQAVNATGWDAEVKAALSVRSLGDWLENQTTYGFVLIGEGYWFLNQLMDLTALDISYGFPDPFAALSTRDFSRHYFPSGLDVTPSEEFLPRAAEQLARNPNVLSLDGSRWVLRNSFDALVEEMYLRLLCADRPITFQELQSDVLAAHPSAEPFFGLVEQAFQQRIAKDRDVLPVSASSWLHGRSLPLLLDLICEQLRARPRRFQDVVREILAPLTHGEESPPEFLVRLENEMTADDHFHYDQDGRWRAIPPGNRLNNTAYVVLFERHRPLARHELEQGVKEKRGRAQHLDLSSDSRFRQWTDRRWMLSEWIIINDHAAEYLASGQGPATKQDIVKRSGVLPELAIFEPERDQRFVSDPSGRWTCRSAGMPLTSQMIDQLVRTASNGMTGVSLDQLVRSTFQRPRAEFSGVEDALLRDGRLLVSDGIWYPRTALHQVSAQEMPKVHALLSQKEAPVPAEEISQFVLGVPLCLTDLEEKLHVDESIGNAGPAGWYLKQPNNPSYGQARRVLYPIHSAKYIPALHPEHYIIVDKANPLDVDPATGRKRAPLPRPPRVTVTLSYEDIRDGTLVVTSILRRFFDMTLALPTFVIGDTFGNPITCWYDSEHDLIQGMGAWFQAQGLYYGDRIRLWPGRERDQFFVEPAGERDEAVHNESMRRNQIHDLLQEAANSNMDIYDRVIEILEFFETPVHVDDLWRLVDSEQTTKKDALLDILGEHSCFHSEGMGYWRFDQKEYDRMIQELEKKVRLLTDENRGLQQTADKISELTAEMTRLSVENEGLRGDLDRATALLKEMTDDKVKLQTSLSSLTSDLSARGAQLRELQDRLSGETSIKGEILEQYNETISQLQAQVELNGGEKASLQELTEKQRQDLQSLEALLRAKEQEVEAVRSQFEKQQASINELGRQLGGTANKLTYMQFQVQEEQEKNEKLQKEIGSRADTFQSALRAREEAYASKAQAIKDMQEKVNEATVAIKNAEKAEAARVAVFEDLENGRREVERLKGQIVDLKAGRDALMAQYARAEADRQQLEKSLNEARRQRDNMIEQYDRLNVDYRALRAADLASKQILQSPLGRLARWMSNPDDKAEEARSLKRKRVREQD